MLQRLILRSMHGVTPQDVTGGKPVLVEGTDLPLAAIELDPEEAREEFRSFAVPAAFNDNNELYV